MLNDFLDNKYKKIYFAIIENAKKQDRVYDSEFHEYHHIIPRSIGGSDDDSNIVILSFREHFICHRLLVKFLTENNKAKMIWALQTFFYFDYTKKRKIRISAKMYEYHKSIFVQSLKYRKPVTRKEIFIYKNLDTNEIFKGTMYEFRLHSGLTCQEVHILSRQNQDKLMRYIKRWGIYLEYANKFSFELKRKSAAIKHKMCVHCNKTIDHRNFSKWHGDNCIKLNPHLVAERSSQMSTVRKSRG